MAILAGMGVPLALVEKLQLPCKAFRNEHICCYVSVCYISIEQWMFCILWIQIVESFLLNQKLFCERRKLLDSSSCSTKLQSFLRSFQR